MDNNNIENNVDEEKLYSKTNDEVSKLVNDLEKGLKAIFQSTNPINKESDEQKQDANCTDKK